MPRDYLPHLSEGWDLFARLPSQGGDHELLDPGLDVGGDPFGHALGAAGGIEGVATALAVARDTMPPTTNYEFPDPECTLDYVPNVARRAPIRVALSNSFGFGGHNSVIVFGKVRPR